MELPDIAGTVRAELARQRKQQQALQSKLNISRSSMARRLNGESPFDANELVLVAEFLGMQVGDLFTDSKASA